MDFLDFHVSASCLRPRRFRSIKLYYKYTPIRCDTLRYKAILQNTHRYEATHDNFKNDTDARRRHMTTSEYTPMHDNTMRYFRIHNRYVTIHDNTIRYLEIHTDIHIYMHIYTYIHICIFFFSLSLSPFFYFHFFSFFLSWRYTTIR